MKYSKIIFAILLGGCAMGASAQGGYQDGVDYYNADRFEQAKIILDKTINDQATDKALAHFYLGSISMRGNDMQAARMEFEKGIAINPDCGLNYVGLGEISLKSNDKKAASDYFEQALKVNKKDPVVSAAIARAYFNADPMVYSKEIEKNIAKSLKDSQNKGSDVYVLKGDMAAAVNNIGEAAGFYEQAMVYDEESGNINPEAYVKYANLYNNTTDKNNKAFAIAKLEELKRKLPTSALAQRELAEKYYDAELYSKAASAYLEYMSNPNHFQQDEQRLCQLLYFDNKNQQSLDIAKNVLANDPGNHYMYRMVMLNDVALKNYTEAVEYGAKLFSTNDVIITSNDYSSYAEALAETGNVAEAAAVLEKGYSANPEKNKGMLADISAMYSEISDFAKAAEYQQRFVDLGDCSLQDLFTLANRYRNLSLSYPEKSAERTDAATKGLIYIDKALETAATKAPLYRNRAVLLQLRDGQEPTDELAETYKLMIAAYDENPDNRVNNADVYAGAFVNLAAYYTKKGDKETAHSYYEKLYEIAPDTPGLAEFLKKK